MPAELTEAIISKGGQNPPNMSDKRPAAPRGSGGISEPKPAPPLSPIERIQAERRRVEAGEKLIAERDRTLRAIKYLDNLSEPKKIGVAFNSPHALDMPDGEELRDLLAKALKRQLDEVNEKLDRF